MELFRVFEPFLNLGFFVLDQELVQRVANGMLQLVETVGLAKNIVGAEAHRLGDLVDRGFTADDDHGGLYFLFPDEG